MARPKEPVIGTRERLALDATRYARTWQFVEDMVREGRTKHDAYLAAPAKLDIPYDTAKKHYSRMQRSIHGAEANGIHFRPELIWTEADTEERSHVHQGTDLCESEREQQQDDLYVQELTEHPIESAFTVPERRKLKGVSRAFTRQLAMERLELINLRNQLKQRKRK